MKSVSLMAALSVLTVNMFLSLFFPADVSGGVDDCGGMQPVLRITTPGMMEALSGSCLLIPCSYSTTHQSSSKTIYGVWRKSWWSSTSNNIFHSDGSVNIYKLNITGNLKDKDCTTLFPDLQTSYSDKYFFRIENELFRASCCADSLQISVKDSAWSPSIEVSGDLQDLKEAESVSITCSAQTPCPDSPPELTWSLQQDSQRTEKNPDGTFTTKIQENVTLSDKHDGDNITCSVRYPVDGGKHKKTAETNLTLSVSYAPKDTSASISPSSGVVSAGSWVELSCSSRAKPPVRTFTWFRVSSDGPVQVSVGQVYSFNVSVDGQFYCVATNSLGNRTSSVISLNLEVDLLNGLLWVVILVVIIMLIVLAVLIWYFKCKCRAPQQTQNQTEEKVVTRNEADKTDELHYGEVKFIKNSNNVPSVSVKDREHVETAYDAVKVSKPENSPTQAAEDLYAQVKNT